MIIYLFIHTVDVYTVYTQNIYTMQIAKDFGSKTLQAALSNMCVHVQFGHQF